MRSSSVVFALAAAAAVTPALAAPVSPSSYSRRQTTTTDSGAVKLGNIADVASIGSSVVSVIHNLFGGSSNQQRRDELESLLARAQNELDESGAISFDTIKNLGSIGGSAFSILHNVFGGSSNNQQRDVQDESGAVKLGNIADAASIGSSVVSVLHNLFGGSNNQQRRDELEALFARAQNELDESGAISFDTIKNIGSIGGSAISILHNIFGGSSDNQQQRRELEELFARQSDVDQSDAIKLGTLGTIFSVGAPVIGGIIDHFKNNGNQQQRRELEELFARADDSSIALNTLMKPSIVNEIPFRFGVPKFNIARQSDVDQSDAIKLGTLGTIFSVGAPIIGGIIDHFKNNGNQQQRRELEELFARADDSSAALSTLFHPAIVNKIPLRIGEPIFNIARQSDADQSDAIKLGTLGTIFSVGAPVIGGIIDHFKNGGDQQQQRRGPAELLDASAAPPWLRPGWLKPTPSSKPGMGSNPKMPMIARQQTDVDQSDAIKLGTLGTIFSVGAPVIGGIIDHFKNNGNQQQRRELEELLARADASGALNTLRPFFNTAPPFRTTIGVPALPKSINDLD
ncbi:hypothetical protein BDY19DRAFT_905487 [Irpex rosettiformis]|uniref:Uncharacterized protein n=1 Tax=Irpex rosettiformis TaxID=378272 RepID=A0ACB8U5Z0_9APHY|nr:hypothetical protein BDY19DRAFT_905487 [Irpex rosettiformis]